MPKKIRIEFNSAGFREILVGSSVGELVKSTASDLAARAGEGYMSSTMYGGFGGGRIIGFVTTDSYEAMKDNAENGTLAGIL